MRENYEYEAKWLLGAIALQYGFYGACYIAEALKGSSIRSDAPGAYDPNKNEVQKIYEVELKDILDHERKFRRHKPSEASKKYAVEDTDPAENIKIQFNQIDLLEEKATPQLIESDHPNNNETQSDQDSQDLSPIG